MDEALKKANFAMLEADRDEVLRLLNNKQSSVQVLWLRAHSVADDDQRLTLLRQVSLSGHPVYAPLAKNILEREYDFESQLAKPAEYKFWTRQPWLGRLRFVKKNRAWFWGGLIFVVLAVIGLVVANWWFGQQQAAVVSVSTTKTAAVQLTSQVTPRPTPSITPQPLANRGTVSYPAGKLSIVRVEFPTNRPITFGNYGNDQVMATPAIGAQFAAIQVEFTCLQAICENPPEAELALFLSNGSLVRYQTGLHPILLEQPGMSRVSNNKSVQGWFVFEIPSKMTPVTLRVVTGEDSPVLELSIPK